MACNDCTKCAHGYCTEVENHGYEAYGYDYSDWYCAHPDLDNSSKLIDSWVDAKDEVKPPIWCPFLKERKMLEPKHKTPVERNAALRAAWGPTKWEDIKPGKIYHLPPVGTEKRKDILIISKTDYILKYREVGETRPNYISTSTIYKSSDMYYKFLVEHKILDMEPELTADDKELMEFNTKTRTYYPSM